MTMQATKHETFDLLTKWMREERLIGYGLHWPSLVQVTGFGFITHLSDEEIVIGFQNRVGPGPESSFKLGLTGAEFWYSDLRDVDDREDLDSSLSIDCRTEMTSDRGFAVVFKLTVVLVPLSDDGQRGFVERWRKRS